MKGRQWTARKLDFLDTNELERTLTQSVLQLNSTFPVKVLVLYDSFCSKLVVSLTLMMPLTRAGAEAIIRCGDLRSEFATLLTIARKKRESEFATGSPARVNLEV